MMKFSSAFLILTTACLRVLPLSSTRRVDPPHQGGGPKPGNFNKFIIIRVSRFWWWMRNGSDVSTRTAVRQIRPEFRRTLMKRSESPRNMFEGEFHSDPFPRKEAVWVRRFLFVLWSFFVYLVCGNREKTKIGRFQYKIGIMIFDFFIDRFGMPNYNKMRMRTICKLGAESIEEMDRFIFDGILVFR